MAPASPTPASSDYSSVPILIVDDNPAKRLALQSILEPLGYSIVEADSGLAALRCLMKQDFAVILLDVRMPTMDGFETAALMRERQQSEMTPIIFITAHGNNEMRDTDLYTQGEVDFIFAPVNPKELRAKVSVFASLFKKAEDLAARARELQASADQLRLLTDVAPIGIFQTDAQNRYVYTNPRWTEITGIPAEKAAGQKWGTVIEWQERADVDADSVGTGTDRAEFSHRFRIQPPGSKPKIVIVTSRSIPAMDGGIAGWVGILADVTSEAGAEVAMADARDKATEASRLKSDFLANMSHEIRTPMNGIIGMTELLLETDLDVRQRDYALIVRNSGGGLLTIINDILDFSKVEAGKLEVEEIDFDVRTIVDDVVDLLNEPALAKGLSLTPAIESSVPDLVRGDPGRVRQVLINLIGNAIKFTHTGEIGVRVSRDEAIQTDTFLRFQVSDTGDGIASDKLETVFQPFIQGDATTSRKYGGTGLGLSISSQLVTLMGGDCGVSSEPGVGSTFWFTISAGADGQHAGAGDDSSTALEWSTSGITPTSHTRDDDSIANTRLARLGPPGHVLLAEDNVVNQQVAKAMLEHLGFEVDVVADGAAAVKSATEASYDAVLMDCQMPILDGYQATREIRRVQGVAAHVPIIAVTASAMSSDQQRCLAAGMDDYLSKPLSLTALGAVLERWAPEEPDHETSSETPSRAVIAATGPHSPTLDLQVLARLTSLGEARGEDLLQRLKILFLADADTRVAALHEALTADDASAVRAPAHALGGASSNLGANVLADLCATLETDGESGNLAACAAGLEEVEAELVRVHSALDSQVATP
jgi:PAS domain S-box-containing protein